MSGARDGSVLPRYRLGMSTAHAHDHDHGHGGLHVHGAGSGSLQSLLIALGLNAAYTLFEVVAAPFAGSLSLLADAGHNLSDVVALSVAAGAVLLARRPATPNRSFGFRRAEILAALVNAVSLIGTEAEVSERLDRFRANGIDRLIATPVHPEVDQMKHTVERLAVLTGDKTS
jgi:cation diffusion facilitator family transporter